MTGPHHRLGRRLGRTLGALGGTLLLVGLAAGCGEDDEVARTWSGVVRDPCQVLRTESLVATAYPDLPAGAPDAGVEVADGEDTATCSLETRGAPPGVSAPTSVAVAVTVTVLRQGDPAADFSRLADYADSLRDPATSDDVQESTDELDGGWWDRGTAWRSSWAETQDDTRQLVETASATRDNLLVTVLVTERNVPAAGLAEAESRVDRLVRDQLDAARDVATTS